MKRKILISALLTLAAIACPGTVAIAQDKPSAPPSTPLGGWKMTGDNPGGYDVALDTTVKHGGNASASLRPRPTAVEGKFGSIVQAIRPDNFRGKRVRFSGFVKTTNVSQEARMWIRIDGPNMMMLDFSNMGEQPIKGTNDWTKYDLVVDVPANAEAIVYGVLLGGVNGQLWVDDLDLAVVSSNIARTSMSFTEEERRAIEDEAKKVPKEEVEKAIAKYRQLPVQPVNLGFEQKPAMPNATPKKP